MAEMVNVVNKATQEHVEEFRGKMIRIPPGGRIKMSRRDAVAFKGQYFAPRTDANKNVKLGKSIFIDRKGEPVVDEEFVSPLTGEKFASKRELDDHLKEHESEAVRDDEAEERIQKRGQKLDEEEKELERRLAAIKSKKK